MDPFDDGEGADAVSAAVPASSAVAGSGDGEPSLLDLDDIFGGGGAAVAPANQNGISAPSVQLANAEPAAQSDVDLLSDIFSAPPVTTPAPVAVGRFDMFAQPPAASNDLFAPQPMAGVAPAMVSMSGSANAIDPFAAPVQQQQPQQQQASSVTPATSNAASVGGPTPSEVSVPGFTHQGLTVEFKCSKVDAWNKQNSVLIAKFINTTDAPLYGLHLQVAVPKYITMEMKPPTSTTVPVTAGSSTKEVTQTISVTNTMLGSKSLMLKVKASFTSKGTKVEHMTTCSGFPTGQF